MRTDKTADMTADQRRKNGDELFWAAPHRNHLAGVAMRSTVVCMANDFRLMDAARLVSDEVQQLLDRARPPLIHQKQLSEASQSIPANVREAYGRREGRERNVYFRVARSSTEETDEHLRANYAARRLPPKVFWALHNRLTVIMRMLNRLMGEDRETG
jgi:four helix bundle protein